MDVPLLNTSPLPQEYELLLGDYEHYLKRWSFRRVKRRLAVARDLLHWWTWPLDQLRPADLAPYLQQRSKTDRGDVRTFTLFLERVGRLPTPQPPDPADVPLQDVAASASVWVGEFLRARKRQGRSVERRAHDRSTLGIFLRTLPSEHQRELTQITPDDIETFIPAWRQTGNNNRIRSWRPRPSTAAYR